MMSAVDSAFAQGRFEQVELIVLRANQVMDSLPVDERVDICLKAGFAMIMLDRISDARAFFIRALDANPTTQLDPIRISPKFRMVFEEVKSTYRPRAAEINAIRGRNVMPARKSSTTIMNLFLPGSGQWSEGRRVRGATTAAIQIVMAGWFAIQLSQFQKARDDYFRITDPARVSATFDAYHREYQRAWEIGIAAGLVYLGAQVDLAMTHPPELKEASQSLHLQCLPSVGGAQFKVTYLW
jgi:hypothetical protein